MTPNRNSSLVGKNPFHFQELTASSLRQVCKIIYNTILCSLVWLVLCCGSIKLTAQVKPIATIPDSLYTDADAIVLKDSACLTIRKIDQYRFYQKKSVLVLRSSEAARDLSRIALLYNNQRKIDKLLVTISSPTGEVQEKVKKGDFKDFSAVGSETMYTEFRIKFHEYLPTVYPYVLTTEVEFLDENTALLPPFNIFEGPRVSILNKTLDLENLTSSRLSSKIYQDSDVPIVKLSEQNHSYYALQNLSSALAEQADKEENTPVVRFALDRFYLAGVEGSGATWQEFGNWYKSKILAGTEKLPPEAKADILQLIGNESDTRKKIQKIYQYVQNRTRYISVQIGIGGWKPMDAASVHKFGYGDCKALTNYTKALLALAGIPSNYTLIYAHKRRQHIDKDFVCVAGNHAILNVPLPNDTIWLECTSQNMAYNLVTPDTHDRDALSIGENETSIVHTPVLNASTNKRKNSSTITLQPNGNISGKLRSTYEGRYYLYHLAEATTSETEFRKNVLEDLTEFQELKIQHTRRLNDRENASYQRDLEFTASKYCKKVGTELLLRAIPYDLVGLGLEKDNSKYGRHAIEGDEQLDEVLFELPKGYIIKDLPVAVEKNSIFGKYALSFQLENNLLKVNRLFHVNDLECDVTQYNSFVTYMDEIVKLDNTKVLLSPQN